MTTTAREPEARKPDEVGSLRSRLAVEVLIGLVLSAVLLLAAWASSGAISFVYGGY